MRGAEAFSKLLPHVHYFDGDDPRHMRQLMEDYLEVVARVPIFTLEYPPSFQSLPQLTGVVMNTAVNAHVRRAVSYELATTVS
jgi:hypothetical protein